jgi:hypothetical protein
MSIRTVIEINHDLLEVLEDPIHMELLQRSLSSGDMRMIEAGCIPGIRFLGQRHHSEKLNLLVE